MIFALDVWQLSSHDPIYFDVDSKERIIRLHTYQGMKEEEENERERTTFY
jgi:hypothetical protein